MSARSPQEIVAELSKYEAKLLFLDCEDRTYGYIGSVLDSSVSKIQRDIGNLRHDKLGLPRDLRGQEDRLAPFCQAINSFVKNLKDIDEGWPPERYIPPTPPPQEPDKPEPPPEPPSEPPRRRFDPRDTPAPWIGIGIGAVLILSCCFVWIFRGQIWRFLFPPPQPTPIQEVVVVRVSATPVPPILTDTPTITLTPTVTYTPTITPTPTITLTPLPTYTPLPSPTPEQVLFFDSFDTGVSPEWGMEGDNFNVGEGRLSSEGLLRGTVGDISWTDYAIEFRIDWVEWTEYHLGLRIFVRRQDDSNYMMLQLNSINRCSFQWVVVEGGNERIILDSNRTVSGDWTQCKGIWRIEADGNTFTTYKDFELRKQFIDETFASGGSGLFINHENTKLRLDYFKVVGFP